ncbi:MAG TPA: AraC family transcriptional regulator [Candidatus Hodarchaeales archaeon]|nr:AraC family transcriptional regulator [Candidatus Hodarchaeales archaeon]
MKKTKPSATSTITLYVKHMVCDRCIRIVKEEMERINLDVRSIKLGEVVVDSRRTPDIGQIRSVLQANGFELIDDKKVKVIEQIKTQIINLVHHSSPVGAPRDNYSEYIAKKVGYEYHYLSSLFSSIENITIEKYIILQRIERVKELLVYNELTLSEIAYQTGYSSVQHLSSQFKKVTGFTPSYFKTIKENKRTPLDKVKEGTSR